MNSRWVCLWFGPGNVFFQAKDFFLWEGSSAGEAGVRGFERICRVTAGYSRRAVEDSEFGVPVQLCPGLYPGRKIVVGKLHAHRWAGSCLLASKWALLPRICDVSPVDQVWLWDLWAQHRVGLVPGSWEIRPGGFRCETSWVTALFPGLLALIAGGTERILPPG